MYQEYTLAHNKMLCKEVVQDQAGAAEKSHRGHCIPQHQHCGLAGQAKGTCTLLFQPLIPRRATGRKGAAAVNSQTSRFQLKWEMFLTPRSRFRLTCGISRTLGVSEVLYSS